MSEKVWNDFQQQAIDAQDMSVVVSAAAGSGKTSVLSERILRLIKQGEDIERMLIVTFTNLAASEMRERIYSSIEQAGRLSDTARLAAQAEKCAFADISTIHSFCIRVIRDNFEHAGVSPKAVIADIPEIMLLKERAMDQTMQNAAGELSQFILRYSQRGDTAGIKKIVHSIYNRVISTRHPEAWLQKAQENFESDEFVYTLFDSYKRMALGAAENASWHLKHRSDIWRLRGFFEQELISEAERISMKKAVQAITVDNIAIPELSGISVKAKGAPNGESAAHTKRADKCLESVRGYTNDFYCMTKKELLETAGSGKIFIQLTRDFSKRYAQAKRAKNVLDHDDTIHFALKALSVPDIAKRYRDKFAHVFVDEYQDINDAQNAIIKSIQRDKNDFLVGDVKQCIYMFRESNPDLLKKRCEELSKTGLIEMNINYRSEKNIIDFINGVMHYMMTEDAGGVEYKGGQRLEAAKTGGGHVEIILAGNEEYDDITAEGYEIAERIRKLVKKGYEYKDIAILRPEVGGSGKHLAKILSDMDIPVVRGFDSVNSGFSEIDVFINLLSLIDGGVSDIALLSVMRYPYFDFTETQLAKIRINQTKNSHTDEDKSFFHAVKTFREDSKLMEKVQSFLNEIARYKKLCKALRLPDFLMKLRQQAQFREYALTSAEGASSDNAISSFISKVSSMKLSSIKEVLEIADKAMSNSEVTQSPGETNSVYITTIHKSKGLEFPVVILSGLHKRIEKRDASGPVLVGRELGLALDTIDETTRIKKPTMHKRAVAANIAKETISEKVRLLYVGMTRAIERLIITGAGNSIKPRWTEDKFLGWQHSAATYLDLLIPAVNMACRQNGTDINNIISISDGKSQNATKTDKKKSLDELFKNAAKAEPEDIFIGYDKAEDIGVPSKVSVSALKKKQEEKVFEYMHLPSQDTEISAAERGTLMHKVLQKIGLGEKSAEQVDICVEQLIEDGVIEKELKKHIDIKALAGFLQSDLAARGAAAEKCFFEAPFCLRMSADEAKIVQSKESVIVQGVIDLCFVENGEWVIVDYKTDKVSEENIKEAAQKYKVQIGLYSKALEDITDLRVKEKYIYFLSVNKKVQMP